MHAGLLTCDKYFHPWLITHVQLDVWQDDVLRMKFNDFALKSTFSYGIYLWLILNTWPLLSRQPGGRNFGWVTQDVEWSRRNVRDMRLLGRFYTTGVAERYCMQSIFGNNVQCTLSKLHSRGRITGKLLGDFWTVENEGYWRRPTLDNQDNGSLTLMVNLRILMNHFQMLK